MLRTSANGFVLEFLHVIPAGYISREAAMFGSEERDRRRFFRLRYSERPYPQLVCRGSQYDVLEVSEAAIVMFSPGLSSFMKGQQILGSVVFHDRGTVPIAGSVYRMTTTEVTVLLARFIPAERMIKEQQYVLQQRGKRG